MTATDDKKIVQYVAVIGMMLVGLSLLLFPKNVMRKEKVGTINEVKSARINGAAITIVCFALLCGMIYVDFIK